MRFLTAYLLFLTIACSYGGELLLNGPFILWGRIDAIRVQRKTLVNAEDNDFIRLYRDSPIILIYIRSANKTRMDARTYPKFENLIKTNAWTYVPHRHLRIQPFAYNTNLQVIYLSNNENAEDEELVPHFLRTTDHYGAGKTLGIIANREREQPLHTISKRQAKDSDSTTTAQTPTANESDDSSKYIADNNKAVLNVNNAPVLHIPNKMIKLVEHNKEITFDDQKGKGFGRLNIIFKIEGERLTLRFNFTISRGSWTMKAVKVESNLYNGTLTIGGHLYSLPSAPVGFSYRCSAWPLIFTNGTVNLTLNDYQVQPWLNGASRFGDVYDCVGFTTAPIWAGVLVTLFLCGILSIGLMALMDIKTPNKFESSRNKQLTFTVQE